jgi:putative sigma-54 modulation protein
MDLVHARSARSARDRHVAQLTVRGKGVLLRAEERTQDIYASVDAVLEKVHRQIERFKGRRWDHRGDGRSAADVAPEPPPEAESAAPYAVARRKKLSLTPMDENEAIDQMALLSHEDFFVYLDSASNTVHVLYRRRDGSLGLIETEVA